MELFINKLTEAFVRGLGTGFGIMARQQPTPDERMKRLYSLIVDAEKRLGTATSAERPIIKVGLDALRKELSSVSRQTRRR